MTVRLALYCKCTPRTNPIRALQNFLGVTVDKLNLKQVIVEAIAAN
ncbi:hypothetical protein [Microcoleus sp. FACHB-831]|nr:hypothetical protein [Microcoleus sp. FACHB-831]